MLGSWRGVYLLVEPQILENRLHSDRWTLAQFFILYRIFWEQSLPAFSGEIVLWTIKKRHLQNPNCKVLHIDDSVSVECWLVDKLARTGKGQCQWTANGLLTRYHCWTMISPLCISQLLCICKPICNPPSSQLLLLRHYFIYAIFCHWCLLYFMQFAVSIPASNFPRKNREVPEQRHIAKSKWPQMQKTCFSVKVLTWNKTKVLSCYATARSWLGIQYEQTYISALSELRTVQCRACNNSDNTHWPDKCLV